MSNAFESEVASTLAGYESAGVATIKFLHPAMRVASMKGRMPLYIPCGKAPFDLGGYYHNCGIVIGVELKQTAGREPSLPLIGPGRGDPGLQYHQLQELVQVHQEGGVALLVYNNAGEVGRLGGHELHLAKIGFDAALKARNPAKGAKSIPWGRFDPVKRGHNAAPLWLPLDPEAWRRGS